MAQDNQMLTRTALLLSLCWLAGCGQDTPAGTAQETAPVAAKAITTPEVHHAVCGCTIAGIRHCGNYVDIDGKLVRLEWPALGEMEFCDLGAKGAQVEITGAMKDGAFVATSYRKVE